MKIKSTITTLLLVFLTGCTTSVFDIDSKTSKKLLLDKTKNYSILLSPNALIEEREFLENIADSAKAEGFNVTNLDNADYIFVCRAQLFRYRTELYRANAYVSLHAMHDKSKGEFKSETLWEGIVSMSSEGELKNRANGFRALFNKVGSDFSGLENFKPATIAPNQNK